MRGAQTASVLSTVGGNSGYPRLVSREPSAELPPAAAAVDNPGGIVPGCGQDALGSTPAREGKLFCQGHGLH